jgi:hypothetical protein
LLDPSPCEPAWLARQDGGVSASLVWVPLERVVRGFALDDPAGSRAEFVPSTPWEYGVALGTSLVAVGSERIDVREGRTGAMSRRFAVPEGTRFGASDGRWLWFTRHGRETSHAISVDEFGVPGPVVDLPPGAQVVGACGGLLLCMAPAFFDGSDVTVLDLDGGIRFQRRAMEVQAVLGPGVLHIGTPTSPMEIVPLLGQGPLASGPTDVPMLDPTMQDPGARLTALPTASGRLELWRVARAEEVRELGRAGPFTTLEATQEVESHVIDVGEDHRRALTLPFLVADVVVADERVVVVAPDPTRRDRALEQAGAVGLHLFDRDLAPVGRVSVGPEPLRGRAVVITAD